MELRVFLPAVPRKDKTRQSGGAVRTWSLCTALPFGETSRSHHLKHMGLTSSYSSSATRQINNNNNTTTTHAMALPQIKPKEAKESNLALLSRIHVSKNWKLPPRLPHRAGQRRKRPHQLHDDEYDGAEDDEELQKKKRQNRDAQRAYRERKNNKLQVLEDTIESLTKIIKNYESKLTRLQDELQERNSENRALQLKLDALAPRQPSVPAQDPILQNLIENFKPMKAIPIKYHAAATKHHQRPAELSNSAKCGFCNDNTTCVCKELETGAAKNAAAQKDLSPPPRPHSHCNKDNSSGLCTNCTNIDKSCIDIQSIVH